MIRLVFTSNRETFTIEIENKVIVYKDRKIKNGFQFMPKSKDFKRIVIFSRNRLPLNIISWVEKSNQGKNLEEYQHAKDNEALVKIVIRDARLNGCILQDRQDIK